MSEAWIYVDDADTFLHFVRGDRQRRSERAFSEPPFWLTNAIVRMVLTGSLVFVRALFRFEAGLKNP